MQPFLTTLIVAVMAVNASTASAQIRDIREMSAAEIEALDRAHTAILLPGGILEEHGPYLPSYSDGYQADFLMTRVAAALAARPGWAVVKFPPLPLGSMPASEVGGKFAFPGSYPVRTATLRAVYMDLASDLGEAGFKWVFLFSAHGAPTHARAIDEAATFFNETYRGRMADAAVKVALLVLDGGSDRALPRVGDRVSDPNFKPLVEPSLAHEREVERRETAWLAKRRQ